MFKRPGDWQCPKCSDVNFAKNINCRKCGAGNSVGSIHTSYVQEAGDWKCRCGEMNFKSRTECRKCGTRKFDDTKIERIEKRMIRQEVCMCKRPVIGNVDVVR